MDTSYVNQQIHNLTNVNTSLSTVFCNRPVSFLKVKKPFSWQHVDVLSTTIYAESYAESYAGFD